MGYPQTFSGVFEFADHQDVLSWYQDNVESDDDQAVADQIIATIIDGRIVDIDVDTYQPASLWDDWLIKLCSLADAAQSGFAVAAFGSGSEMQLEVIDASTNPKTPAVPIGDEKWFSIPDVWKIGPGEHDVLWATKDGNDTFSIRQAESEPFNETLGIRFLKQKGSAILDADNSDQLWIDCEWRVGQAAMVQGPGVLSIQQAIGDEEFSREGVSVPAKRFSVKARSISTYPPDYEQKPIPTPSYQFLLAKGLGIVELGLATGAPQKEPLLKPEEKKKWWRFW